MLQETSSADHKLLVRFRDAGASADKKLKPANSVKVRHILCEKQSKVCLNSSPTSRLGVQLYKLCATCGVAAYYHSKRAKQRSRQKNHNNKGYIALRRAAVSSSVHRLPAWASALHWS